MSISSSRLFSCKGKLWVCGWICVKPLIGGDIEDREMRKVFIGARAKGEATKRDDVILIKNGSVEVARFDIRAIKLDP